MSYGVIQVAKLTAPSLSLPLPLSLLKACGEVFSVVMCASDNLFPETGCAACLCQQ